MTSLHHELETTPSIDWHCAQTDESAPNQLPPGIIASMARAATQGVAEFQYHTAFKAPVKRALHTQ